jgi:hypothetical protein
MNIHSSAVRAPSKARAVETRVSEYDWETLSADLSGYAVR